MYTTHAHTQRNVYLCPHTILKKLKFVFRETFLMILMPTLSIADKDTKKGKNKFHVFRHTTVIKSNNARI